MNMPATTTVAAEINRLCDEAQRLATESRASLQAALAAAWSAGRLLLEEKKRVRRLMGGGAWLLWLEQNFRDTPRTAQNYMRLAREVADVASLQGMSLRQVYLNLGISTEPKSRVMLTRAASLPPHIRLANRLLVALKARSRQHHAATLEQAEAYRRDLRALFDHLQRLFSNETGTNLSASRVSNHHTHESIGRIER
jgi:hypothetical protein